MGAAAALAAGVFFLVAPSSENSAQPAQLALEEPAALFLTPQQRADEEQVISVQAPPYKSKGPRLEQPLRRAPAAPPGRSERRFPRILILFGYVLSIPHPRWPASGGLTSVRS